MSNKILITKETSNGQKNIVASGPLSLAVPDVSFGPAQILVQLEKVPNQAEKVLVIKSLGTQLVIFPGEKLLIEIIPSNI